MDDKYVRMVRGMKRGRRRDWSVYVLRCGDGSLYTGIAKDVQNRLEMHRRGRGAAYTRTHLPVDLVYEEPALSHSQALCREMDLKRLPRKQKQRIVEAGSTRRGKFKKRGAQ